MVEVPAETADTARRELDMLIERTRGEEPDPLTDDVFQARDELEAVLEAAEQTQISNRICTTMTDESVRFTDSDGNEIILSDREFRAAMTKYINHDELG